MVFYFMLTLNGFAVFILDDVAVKLCVVFCRTAERVLSVAWGLTASGHLMV